MAEAPENQLPSGYDEDFVNAVEDEILCLICQLPLKEPVLTRCGHRFCKDCLEEHFKRQGIQKQASSCPADRESLDRDKDVFPDKATERKILSFAIKCPSEGCDWTGELRNKKGHLASCLFKLVSCTNQNCHVAIQRKELEEHVTITCQWKIIKCDHCNELHPECKMKDHVEQCSKFPVTCPNNCGDSIPREMIPNHIEKDCSLTIISCSFAQMGCETKIQRRQRVSHLESAIRLHLDLACAKLKNAELKLNDTEIKLNDTQVKLKDTEVKLQDTQKTTRHLTRKLETLQRQFEEKRKEDQENKAKRKIVMVKNEIPNFPGVFVWKINDLSKTLRLAQTREIESIECTPFYTESYGYKLKVRIYPNGYESGKGTHLSVFIVVMKGEYDALLPWPFKKEVKFTVIDQQEDPDDQEDEIAQLSPGILPPRSFARPTEVENSSFSGFTRFISHTKLHSRRYIVDDTLFLKVEVGP